MSEERIPPTTVARLPLYLRCLLELRASGMSTVNSIAIAEMTGGNAAQVRKDLSYLGELGIRGVGYDIESLSDHLSKVLGLHKRRRAAIVGFGRLGGALWGYEGFRRRGIEVVAVFDSDPERASRLEDGPQVLPASDLERELRERRVEVVIVATPIQAAQWVADRAVAAGVCGILNFAPTRLQVPPSVAVRQVDLSAELDILSFYVAKAGGDERGSVGPDS